MSNQTNIKTRFKIRALALSQLKDRSAINERPQLTEQVVCVVPMHTVAFALTYLSDALDGREWGEMARKDVRRVIDALTTALKEAEVQS